MINHSYDTRDVDWSAVTALFRDVGWGERDPLEIRRAFEKSSYVIFIHDGDELVAFGRTMDDGQYYALLVDVVVKPGRQQGGLGRVVVDYLKSNLGAYRFITLTSAPGKEAFYRKLGWKKQKSAFIWPVSAWQEEQHADTGDS